MHVLLKDMGRVLEAVEQSYKTQESLWRAMNSNKAELSEITTYLKTFHTKLDHMEAEISELKNNNKILNRNFQKLQADYNNNKRWIRGIVGVIVTAVPLIWTQVDAKLEDLTTIDSRLNSVEWVFKRDLYDGEIKFSKD